MSAHTPGPWAWQKFDSEYCLTGQYGMHPIVLTGRRGLTSLVQGRIQRFDPDHPDSHLIAAAPELLEALKLAKKTVECDSLGSNGEQLPWYKAAVRAIAKAEGKE